jgi:hypothetical protein
MNILLRPIQWFFPAPFSFLFSSISFSSAPALRQQWGIWVFIYFLFFLLYSYIFPIFFYLFTIFFTFYPPNAKAILFSIYGYSNIFLLYGSIIASVPEETVSWIALLIGALLSLIFLYKNLNAYILGINPNSRTVVLIIFSITQIFIYFLYYALFFQT